MRSFRRFGHGPGGPRRPLEDRGARLRGPAGAPRARVANSSPRRIGNRAPLPGRGDSRREGRHRRGLAATRSQDGVAQRPSRPRRRARGGPHPPVGSKRRRPGRRPPQNVRATFPRAGLRPRDRRDRQRRNGGRAGEKSGRAVEEVDGIAAPLPRSAIPGRSQVALPISRTIVPLTTTRSNPRDSWCGSP